MTRPRPPPLRKGLPATGYNPRARPPPPSGTQNDQDIHPVYLYLSLIPLLTLVAIGVFGLVLTRLRKRNEARKEKLLKRYGWEAGGGGEGTSDVQVEEVSSSTTTTTTTLRNRKNVVPTQTQSESTETKTGTGSRRDKPLVVGFWHPYCNAGGGGERVLWTAIAWAQRTHPEGRVLCCVYTGDYPAVGKEEILGRVKERFDIPLDATSIHFIPLPSRHLISDSYWRRFTLLGQSIGSVWLALEGLVWGKEAVWPDIFIDTMGYAFTLPLLSILSGTTVPLGSYVHYPTISTDMMRRVRERKVEGTNAQGVSASAWKTRGKLLYYRLFTHFYATALMYSNVTLTNSSWTQAHIQNLLKLGHESLLSSLLNFDKRQSSSTEGEPSALQPPLDERGQPVYDPPRIVYPPCATREFTALPLSPRSPQPVLISLAQFRPEKDQAKQIRAVALLCAKWPEWRGKGLRLVMMGSSRNKEDEERVSGLRELARELGVQDQTEFVVNAPFDEIVKRLGQASIGLNTMQDEHFGISVVEFMAAGLIPLAHASAGPLLDIITPTRSGHRTGFHATDAESFAERIHEILSLPDEEQEAIRRAAREKAEEAFAVEVFENGWKEGWGRLMAMKLGRRGRGD